MIEIVIISMSTGMIGVHHAWTRFERSIKQGRKLGMNLATIYASRLKEACKVGMKDATFEMLFDRSVIGFTVRSA
jgi:hypothetical protein